MSLSISSNFWHSSSSNVNLGSSGVVGNFSGLLEQLNSTDTSAEQKLNYLKLGKVSKEEAMKAISNIKNKMDEVIEAVKKQGNMELYSKLSEMRDFNFQTATGGYNLTLDNLEEATNKIKSLNPKDLKRV